MHFCCGGRSRRRATSPTATATVSAYFLLVAALLSCSRCARASLLLPRLVPRDFPARPQVPRPTSPQLPTRIFYWSLRSRTALASLAPPRQLPRLAPPISQSRSHHDSPQRFLTKDFYQNFSPRRPPR